MTCLLVVVAHPDDETFGCGSLLLHAARRGARTVVVCATRGEAGDVADGVPVPPDGVGALREAELRAAATSLGVAEVEVLDLRDSGMDGDAPPESLVGAPIEVVRSAVAAAVERHRPDVVVVLAGDDGHRDHVRVREAAVSVLAGGSTPLYAHCLPRSLMHRWVLHHAGDDARAAYTELPEIGTPDDELTTYLDTSALLDRRDAAMALHASQHPPYDGLPDDLRRAFLGGEHLVRLNPPWDGGPLEHDLLGL